MVALGGIPGAFFFPFPVYPDICQITKSIVKMNKKNLEQTELSYYGLYLLNYLKENKFEQASDAAFVKARADEAAEAYERARLEGYTPDGAQEIAMSMTCSIRS